jgi:adenylate cyclase
MTGPPSSERPVGMRGRAIWIGVLVLLPLVGLGLLLLVPEIDLEWQHQPSHFLLVFGVAFVNVVLGLLASEAARQREDPRLFLVSMALLASSGFLALHALATPGVVLDEPNAGFVIATPIGLLLAAAFAATSAAALDERRSVRFRTWQTRLRLTLAAVLIAWAVGSLAELPLLDRAPQEERVGWVLVLLPVGVLAYGFAALRYLDLYRRRRQVLPLAVAVAFVLLAEALIAVAFGRAWHLSWWEWHVLMAIAFGAILVAARHEYRRERSVPEAFGGLYTERTLERLDRRRRSALLRLTDALRSGQDPGGAAARLRDEGFTGQEVAVLERAAEELARVDGLLHRYLGPQLADQLHREPAFGDLGGREREITALFADLVGFTPFSEGHDASEVVSMLNAYWSAVVPAIVDGEGGVIERFAGDGLLAVFNALGDQSDHALRAARAAVAVQDRTEELRRDRHGWPRFRVALNTGTAVIGSVGSEEQRSFSAIGDTTNVAARLQAIAAPGGVVIGAATREQLGERARVDPLGPVELKGKSRPLEAYRLLGVDAETV